MGFISIGKMPERDYFVQTELDRLRVNIGFLGSEKKVLMITSSEPNEGKSYVSFNLWDELANSGKLVCHVDLDMRKSVTRRELQLSVHNDMFYGITHYLSGQCAAEEILYRTNRENGYMIPTATTIVNPSILFEGNILSSLIASLRETFDYVILDTPPIGVVSDGQLIGKYSDGCILVVRAHHTTRSAVRNAMMHLKSANCPVLGIVLNRVEAKKSGGYYTSYK